MKRFVYTAINKIGKSTQPIATVYYWHPTDLLGRRKPHPVSGFKSMGLLGHISLHVKFSNGEEGYISVWEMAERIDSRPQVQYDKKAYLSESLEQDKYAEKDREPEVKSIELSSIQEEALKEHIDKLKEEFAKEIEPYPIWDIYNNCSNFVFNALETAGLTYRDEMKMLPMTPKYVFERAFKVESLEEIEAKEVKSNSYLSPSQE